MAMQYFMTKSDRLAGRPEPSGRSSWKCPWIGLGAALVGWGFLGATAWGQVRSDEVTLHSGQVLVGSVEERRTGPQNSAELLVSLEDGTVLVLQREMFRTWKPEPAAMEEYRQRSESAERTVTSQWELAQWCKENRLKEQADFHARLVLEIDSDFEPARKHLGHLKIRGKWVDFDQLKVRIGYVKVNNRWVLPEVAHFAAALKEQRDLERTWKRDLSSLFRTGFSNNRRAAEARAQIMAIRDPAAVGPLVEMLKAGRPQEERALILRVLAEIPSTASTQALIDYYLFNRDDDEMRDHCLRTLVRRKEHQVLAARRLVSELDPDKLGDRSKVSDPELPILNTLRLSRAAMGLRALEVPIGIEDLIAAIRVPYTLRMRVAGGAGLGPGGASGYQGAREVKEDRVMECPAAVDTLQAFTGQRFGNDQAAWMRWWIAENTPVGLDLRRDY